MYIKNNRKTKPSFAKGILKLLNLDTHLTPILGSSVNAEGPGGGGEKDLGPNRFLEHGLKLGNTRKDHVCP